MRSTSKGNVCRLLFAVGLLLPAASLVFAQRGTFDSTPFDTRQQPAKSGFVIKRAVHRVVLDIVVQDSQGAAVPGLTRKDFTVAESGKSQDVLSFEEHDFNTPVAAPLGKQPKLPANTYVNLPTEAERGPLYAIVYDAVDSSWDDQPRARRALMEFLASKPAGTRFALFILSDGLHLAQGFTTDPKELLTVFDVHRKGAAHIPWVFLYGDNYGTGYVGPLQAMINIGHYLQGLPGRKNLIWMSSSMPAAFPVGGFHGAAPVHGPLAEPVLLDDLIRETVDVLTDAQVSVYPIDTAGLQIRPVLPGGIDVIGDEIAENTGGHAFYNGNNIKLALTQAIEHGSNYYEVSYSPSNTVYDGRIRKIGVKLSGRLAKQGYRLSYRRFYYGTDPDAPSSREKRMPDDPDHPRATKRNDPLVAHLEHGAPMDYDLLFRAHISPAGEAALGTPEQMAALVDEDAYLRARRKNKPVKVPTAVPLQTYAIDYTVLDRAVRAQTASSGPASPVLEFGAAAYDSEGRLINGIVQPAATAASLEGQTENRKGIYRAVQDLEVPTNARWLRVAVRDLATQSIGTLEVPLPLPAGPAN